MQYISTHDLRVERHWSKKAIHHCLACKKVVFFVKGGNQMGYPLKSVLDAEKTKVFLELMAEYFVELKTKEPLKAEAIKEMFFSTSHIEDKQIEKKARALALIVALQELNKIADNGLSLKAIELVEFQLKGIFPTGIPSLAEFLSENCEMDYELEPLLKQVV